MNIFWHDVMPFVTRFGGPIIIVLIGSFLGPQVKKYILRISAKSPNKGAMTFLASTLNILVIAVSFIIAMEQLGVKLNSIVALISALGLGISLALKGNMANVAGGLQILVTKPFKVGDYIKISNHKGIVTAVELMFTTIRTDNGKEVVVPNNLLVSDILTNMSREPYRRITIPFPVPAPGDIRGYQNKARQIIAENPYLLKKPEAVVTVQGFAEGYVNLLLIGYVDIENYEKCHYSLCQQLAEGIEAYQEPVKDDAQSEALSLQQIANAATVQAADDQDDGTSKPASAVSSSGSDSKTEKAAAIEDLKPDKKDDQKTEQADSRNTVSQEASKASESGK